MEDLLNIVKGLKKPRETGNLKHIYKNKLDKFCFAHENSKDLPKKLFQIKLKINLVNLV